MVSITVECKSLQDIVDAWNDGWIGCQLDKQAMRAVVEMIAAQHGVQSDGAKDAAKNDDE